MTRAQRRYQQPDWRSVVIAKGHARRTPPKREPVLISALIDYASSTSTTVKVNSLPSATTRTWSPSCTLPSSIWRASGSAMRCWMTRLSGRAPKAGS